MSRLLTCFILGLSLASPTRAALVTWEISGQFYSHWSHALSGQGFRGKYVFDLDRAAVPSSDPRATFHYNALIYSELYFGLDSLVSGPPDEMLVRVNDTQRANPPYDGMFIAVQEGVHTSNGGHGDLMFAWLSLEDQTMAFLETTALAPAVLLGDRWLDDDDGQFTVRFWDDSPQGFSTASGRVNSLVMTIPAPATVFLLGFGLLVLVRPTRRASPGAG